MFKGEINIDQSALAGVLGSNQKSARVTFVRVGEEGVVVENQVTSITLFLDILLRDCLASFVIVLNDLEFLEFLISPESWQTVHTSTTL